jgi:nucleoside-diphosphate-sugar epimerase
VRVRVLDDFSRELPHETVSADVECIKGDIRDAAILRTAVQGCDFVFHLAAEATVMGCEQHPDRAQEVNAAGTYNVLRLSADAGVQRVVFASSREVYGQATSLPVRESAQLNPKNVYGATKAAAEMYCNWARSFMEVVVLRLANVVGAGDAGRVIPRFIDAAASGRPLLIYGGNQVIDFVSVDVAVQAFIRAAFGEYVTGAVNIATGTGVNIVDAARRVLQACLSASELKILATRTPEVSEFIADTTLMQSSLGVTPSTDALGFLISACRSKRPSLMNSSPEGSGATTRV